MNKLERLCVDLIDEIDDLVFQHYKKVPKLERLEFSLERKTGPDSVLFNQKKFLLINSLKEAFIEARSKSLKVSSILTFCFQSGLELVSYKECPQSGAQFIIRTGDFDILVNSQLK